MNLSRRSFIRKSAISATAIQTALITGSYGFGLADKKKIFLPPGSDLAVTTAAEALSESIGATIVKQAHSGNIQKGDIILVIGEEVKKYSEASNLLPDLTLHREWELVKKAGDGMLFSGSTARNLCRVVLGWIENPTGETDRFSSFRFEERYTMWDNSLNQWYRFSLGFDRQRHVRDIARLGFTGMEINRYADPEGYHVIHRKFPQDSYGWYMSYAPALDAFVESSYTKGIYPQDELKANMADLREAAKLARQYGIKPGFVCYEPRGVAEEVFDRHPELRGTRIDHPGRSLQPRYSLDIANPKVLEHYAESITNLMTEVPDLSYFVFWTQDSGSGMPFSRRLYAGPNGSYIARSKTLGQLAADFTSAILDAGRKLNPDFEVIMKMDWEYRADERNEIAAAMPEGSTLVHIFGNRAIKGGEFDAQKQYVIDDRKLDVEPYAAICVSSSWEAEPIIGITRPSILVDKISFLERLKLKRIFAQGGIFSASLCPYDINQELYLELIRGDIEDLDQFLLDTATRWCKGKTKSAKQLVKAWGIADEALEAWPQLNWFHSGAGTTQGRWLSRPLVPDITLLNEGERIAWERELFTLPWDIGRENISFEGGIRMFTEKQFADAIVTYDEVMIPKLKEVVHTLNDAMKSGRHPAVIEDQRDRYQGFLYRTITTRNLFEAQLSTNNWLMKKGNQEDQVKILKEAILSEIDNIQDWIALLQSSKVSFFRTTELRETPFQYKTPIEDFELKLQVMQDHINDTPGPDLAKELLELGSDRKLKFY